MVLPNPNRPLLAKVKRLAEALFSILKKSLVIVPLPLMVKGTEAEEVASMIMVDWEKEERFGEVVAGEEVPTKRPPKIVLGVTLAVIAKEPSEYNPPLPTFTPEVTWSWP